MAYLGYSTGARTTTGTTLSISTKLTPPAGGTAVAPPVGTLLIAGMQGGTDTATLSVPTGFTAIPNCGQQITGNVGTQGAWYRIADGTEASTLTFTSTASDYQTAYILGFSGRNTSSPFTASTPTAEKFGTSPFALVTNAVASAGGDDVAILGGHRFYDGTDAVTYTPPTGFGNNQVVYGAVQYSPIAFFSIDQNVTSGAYGSSGGTITTADTSTLGFSAYIVSLAANPTLSTFVSYVGTGDFAWQGAVEIVNPTTGSGTGMVKWTGYSTTATIGFPAFVGTLVGSPDYVVNIPYRPFTVVLL